MLQNRIAKRYAKSLFLVGEREGLTDKLGSELELMAKLVKETDGLLVFLANPATNSADKHRILEEVVLHDTLWKPCHCLAALHEVFIRELKLTEALR